MHTNSNGLYDILYFAAFSAGSVQLKKPSVGPEGLIGPPCHGAPGRQRQRALITDYFYTIIISVLKDIKEAIGC